MSHRDFRLFVEAREILQETVHGVFLSFALLSPYTLVREVLIQEDSLMKDLVLLGLLLQTMMVKPRKIFGKFEYLCKARYNPLVVNNFNHFMRKQAIWQRKHPELMSFLCEYPQELPVRELIVCE